jgi:hypothetical protein
MIITATLLNATGICATVSLAYMVVQAFRGGH